jgi:hypothetical protein
MGDPLNIEVTHTFKLDLNDLPDDIYNQVISTVLNTLSMQLWHDGKIRFYTAGSNFVEFDLIQEVQSYTDKWMKEGISNKEAREHIFGIEKVVDKCFKIVANSSYDLERRLK